MWREDEVPHTAHITLAFIGFTAKSENDIKQTPILSLLEADSQNVREENYSPNEISYLHSSKLQE